MTRIVPAAWELDLLDWAARFFMAAVLESPAYWIVLDVYPQTRYTARDQAVLFCGGCGELRQALGDTSSAGSQQQARNPWLRRLWAKLKP